MSYRLKRPAIVWKQVFTDGFGREPVLAKLRIPVGALTRFNPFNHRRATEKNRCSQARVLGMWRMDKRRRVGREVQSAFAGWNHSFVYTTGKVVRPSGFEFSPSNATCGPGIHFFRDRDAARHY
jgi:hypothetical protein